MHQSDFTATADTSNSIDAQQASRCMRGLEQTRARAHAMVIPTEPTSRQSGSASVVSCHQEVPVSPRPPTSQPGGTRCLLFCSLAALMCLASGCGADDATCYDLHNCHLDAGEAGIGGGGSGGSGGSDAQSGATGAGGTLDASDGSADREANVADISAEDTAPLCDNDASPYAAPCNMKGVFVSPLGNNQNSGSKDKPVATIEKALTADNPTRRIYVCAPGAGAGLASTDAGDASAEADFTAAMALVSPLPDLHIWGGFDCASWTQTRPTRIKTEPGKTPLTISGASGLIIEGFDFEAADGADLGQSSIAAFVQSSTNVTLRGVTLKAGKGHRGADGEAPSPNYSDAAHAGGDASGTSGGAACENTCVNKPSAVSSRGGRGGSVQAADSGADAGGPEPGEDGSPDLGATSDPDGKGGTVSPSCNAHTGASAPPASGGNGARTYGSLTSSGWTPDDGAPGETGLPGQGGGGGAAAKTPQPGGGGGGGGGGCGGCGGTGGPAGKGGGSSIALVSLSSTITLEACTLSAAEAGAGGNGALGQDGQVGGLGGDRAGGACSGGNGGNGGAGGLGGGGAGGLSVGIAYKGSRPSLVSTTPSVSATPAPGGGSGSASDAGTQGDAGSDTKGIDGLSLPELLIDSTD